MSAEAAIRPWRMLYLIGARGSGKTTVGRIVAAKLGLPFIDADFVLEQKTGRLIREIFATEGEAWFREREEEVLAELAAMRRHPKLAKEIAVGEIFRLMGANDWNALRTKFR